MPSYRTVRCDVLVIGAGAAGLRAAIELKDRKVDVAVVAKSRKKDAHTVLATGGINAALGTMDPEDNWLFHAYDTMKEGVNISNPRAVEVLCRKAPAAVRELVGWGARFENDKSGKIVQRFFGAALYRRACFYGDYTGREIIRVLTEQAIKRKMRYYPAVYVAALLKKGCAVAGALAVDGRGKFIVFRSRATILAAGGYSRIYKRSSSRNYENFGDGIRLAFDAGADLQDMEMLQFHPTGMIWPPEAEGILVTEAVRGEGGRLFNTKGDRFMKRYDPKRMELSARDIVARSIYSEIMDGRGTKHGGVWEDITHIPKAHIIKRLPRMYKQFREYAHVDITKDRMEVAPTSHYSMGGVRVNFSTGKTTVKNLFCVGENTAGLHGANRLGGNSLAETVVFGKITGSYVAKHLPPLLSLEKDEVSRRLLLARKIFSRSGHLSAQDVKRQIQEIMWEHVGIRRNANDMKKALEEIVAIRSAVDRIRVETVEDFTEALNAASMALSSEAVIRSALERKESRGAHFRTDFPKTLPGWKANVFVKNHNGKMKVVVRKVPKPSSRLASILRKKLEPKYHHLE